MLQTLVLEMLGIFFETLHTYLQFLNNRQNLYSRLLEGLTGACSAILLL